jgi:glycosyltransferase involved in cell wall biosynthesis
LSGRNRPLKILHIDPERNWGGGEAQVFGLLAYLAARGHRNDLLTDPAGALWARCQSLAVTTRPIHVRNDIDLRYVPALRRLIKNHRYDLVHFHTKRAHALSLWLPRFRGGPKYVVTRRMDYPERRNFYTHWLYNRRVDGVVAISGAIRGALIEAGVEAGKIRLIPSGIDVEAFSSGLATQQRERAMAVVGCLAALEVRKGQRFLLEAAAVLKNQAIEVEIRFAGDGPERAALEVLASRLGLSDRVCFLGFVPEPAGFLAAVDIVALPSLYEGLGVAALEAMAAGKPVVATRVGGLAESVIDGVTGFLVPPKDAPALAEAIATLVRHPALAAAMGERGREHVARNFSLVETARQNEAFYYDLLDSAS